MHGRIYRAAYFALLLPGFNFATPALHAIYQEYQVAGSLAAPPGYSFATGQYRLYGKELFTHRDSIAFEYDLDSVYAEYGYALHENLRAGINGKAHAFDYQNLNHIVDSATGAESRAVSLVAPYYRGAAFLEGRLKNFTLRYALGAQKYGLSARDSSTSQLRVQSPGAAIIQQITAGYWNLAADRSYAFTGTAFYYAAEFQYLDEVYAWEISGRPLSNPQQKITIHELHVRYGTTLCSGCLRLTAAGRAGATSFSLPGESQDVIQSFSIGGPESRYRRVAGYSFSEFRVPAFGLVNLDAIAHIAGPLNLWLVADAVTFDREYNGRRVHAGAGAGIIFDLPEYFLGSRSALFARAEVPFFAAGANRFQVFLGLNGQIF